MVSGFLICKCEVDRSPATADIEPMFEIQQVLEGNYKAVLIKVDAHDLIFDGLVCGGDEQHVAKNVAFDASIHESGIDLVDIVLGISIDNASEAGL